MRGAFQHPSEAGRFFLTSVPMLDTAGSVLKFDVLAVRSHMGLGAEKASSH
jgi:hypothetical protein